jgi:hypothetical protein
MLIDSEDAFEQYVIPALGQNPKCEAGRPSVTLDIVRPPSESDRIRSNSLRRPTDSDRNPNPYIHDRGGNEPRSRDARPASIGVAASSVPSTWPYLQATNSRTQQAFYVLPSIGYATNSYACDRDGNARDARPASIEAATSSVPSTLPYSQAANSRTQQAPYVLSYSRPSVPKSYACNGDEQERGARDSRPASVEAAASSVPSTSSRSKATKVRVKLPQARSPEEVPKTFLDTHGQTISGDKGGARSATQIPLSSSHSSRSPPSSSNGAEPSAVPVPCTKPMATTTAATVSPPRPQKISEEQGKDLIIPRSEWSGLRRDIDNVQTLAYKQMEQISYLIEQLQHRDVTPSVEKPAPVPETTQPDPPAPVVHDAACDLCDSQIQGIRYKCLNCPDWG